MRRSISLLLAALIATLGACASASADVRTGPGGTRFYTPPKDAPGRSHGDVIWTRALTGPARLSAASRNTLVLYRGSTARGQQVPVSGAVAVPKGRAPKGGWPVISWAHGTSGIADPCAPTRETRGGPIAGQNGYVAPLLDRWLKAGWAVVRTDYQGLGTPGVHPYLVGVPSGRDVLDMVRAARKVDRRIGKRVVVSGHSQGGHAALWAGAQARRYTPELDVRATVAFAPASRLQRQIPLVTGLTAKVPGLTALVASIARGLAQADSSLNVPAALSDRARALYPQTLSRCLGTLARANSYGALTPSEVLRPGPDLGPFTRLLARQDPSSLRFAGQPVRIEQGLADNVVFPAVTNDLNAALRSRNRRVSYRTVAGADHVAIVSRAATDATRYIRARLR